MAVGGRARRGLAVEAGRPVAERPRRDDLGLGGRCRHGMGRLVERLLRGGGLLGGAGGAGGWGPAPAEGCGPAPARGCWGGGVRIGPAVLLRRVRGRRVLRRGMRVAGLGLLRMGGLGLLRMGGRGLLRMGGLGLLRRWACGAP